MTINEAQNPPSVQPAGGAVAPQPQGAALADLAKAQELLLRLLTLLTPMTSSSGSGQGGPLSIPIEGKKYDPPGQRPDVLTRQPVRLLPPLEQMRREVAQLISTLEGKPEGEGAEGKTATAESASKPGQLSASARPMTTKQTFEAGSIFTRPRPVDPKASPLQKPAEKAIDEVRSVIRFLATSSNLSRPNWETVQVAMKQVQPTIEHLIKTVEKLPSRPQTQSAAEPKPTETRPAEARPVPTNLPPQELPELLIPRPLSSLPEGVDQALAEQQHLTEPKVHGPVPFQQMSSDERRRRERKKQTEKSLFWEEEIQPDSDEEEQES